MEREDLTATRYLLTRVGAALLVVVGLVVFLAQPEPVVRFFGGTDRLFGYGLAAAFLLLAWFCLERHKLRVQSAELMEALHQLLYGKSYRRDREAIEILLRALESGGAESARTAYEHLLRLTGQNFAQDPRVWRSWWEANRRHFEMRHGAAAPPPERGDADEAGRRTSPPLGGGEVV